VTNPRGIANEPNVCIYNCLFCFVKMANIRILHIGVLSTFFLFTYAHNDTLDPLRYVDTLIGSTNAGISRHLVATINMTEQIQVMSLQALRFPTVFKQHPRRFTSMLKGLRDGESRWRYGCGKVRQSFLPIWTF